MPEVKTKCPFCAYENVIKVDGEKLPKVDIVRCKSNTCAKPYVVNIKIVSKEYQITVGTDTL